MRFLHQPSSVDARPDRGAAGSQSKMMCCTETPVACMQAYAHYQRAASNEDGEAVGPAPSKGLWDEDPIKRLPMYQAVAAEETAFPVGRSQDPRDPFDIALEEYQAVPDSNLTMHQSKHGSFLGPSHMTPAVL